ncbi:hypothetical protein RhiirA5_402901 [Rhizophagus irregularis]|uniref:Uncharacterized protein n=1 Tax=Rhizophagus irregularis TaxID=588596 RepID=A0A2I1F1V6_9GLOM|nr:hypothetical protein RhiirA5_402901 [Rhizophagus irregularis]PKY28359.1 hypothetical protein RhiirB3_473895 [Rhizophagus irregularis]
MINKNLIFLLVITDTHPIIKLNQVHVNAVTQGYVPRNIDIERSPKNILVSSFLGGRSHLKPILDVATVLIERPQPYAYEPFAGQLNDIRDQMNIKSVSEKVPKVSLALIDTLSYHNLQHQNVQEIGPVLSEEYPHLRLNSRIL